MSDSGRIGPGASTILMILAVLVMTMLGVLALSSARSDLVMSERMDAAARAYYQAQAGFSQWTLELDGQLIALRARAGEDAALYERLVGETFGVRIGEALDYSAPVDATRIWRAQVRILPLADAERFQVLGRVLESEAPEEEADGTKWSLIA